MKPSNKTAVIAGIAVIVVAIAIAAGVIFLPRRSAAPTQQVTATTPPSGGNNQVAATSTATAPIKMAPVPHGTQTYQIMQAAAVMPKIVQATVDPVDVHVGDTQTLTVIVSDPSPVTSVVATIHTDNGITNVPLALVGPAALNDVLPQKYFVNAKDQLALVDPNTTSGASGVAQAAQGDEKYSATWTVKDTHVAKYYTIFTATDAQGNMNSATINWTDALCTWAGFNNFNGATWSVSSSSNGTGAAYGSGGCALGDGIHPVMDGVENANVNVNAPITINPNAAFVLNSGYQMTFSGSGSINIVFSSSTPPGQIKFGSEMYCASSSWVTSFSNPADGTYQVARSALSNNVFPGQTAYFSSPATTNYGTSTYNYNCGPTVVYQYSGTASLSVAGGCSGPTSCTAPQGSLGIEGTIGCGAAVPEVVDEGQIAVCMNNGQPTGQTCDVWASVSSSSIQQGCY